MINDIILPDLATALEEFDEVVRFMEETKPIDMTVLDIPNGDMVISPVEVVENDTLLKATKTSNIVLQKIKCLPANDGTNVGPSFPTCI